MRLEVIQKMTACISCLLCCQDNVPVSRKAGTNRLIITAIGGLAGIVVICIDNVLGNPWIMTGMIALGILATLFLCKAAGVPYINARIGGVTFYSCHLYPVGHRQDLVRDLPVCFDLLQCAHRAAGDLDFSESSEKAAVKAGWSVSFRRRVRVR